MKKTFYICALCALAFTACRKDDVNPSAPVAISARGFYVLNEGNMGTNKASLDYYNLDSGIYYRNVYAGANPTVPMELGDVGNDLKIYGGKMYAVINGSNKVEVMHAHSAVRIGQVEVPNCRYIAFAEGYAYVSSYAGPVDFGGTNQRGYIAKIDTANLQKVGECLVGYQPDGLAVVGNKLYVANSGGYQAVQDSTLSVIDLSSFAETKRLTVGVNPDVVQADRHGNLWGTTRGNYFDIDPTLYYVDEQDVVHTLPSAAANFCINGDSLYFYATAYDADWKATYSYGIVNISTKAVVSTQLITDGTAIQNPYGIAVNPVTKDVYITDAKDYVSPGELYCFDKSGKLQWRETTGDAPGHITILP
jgi:DNA-binding beta-propeller fold protein YncE